MNEKYEEIARALAAQLGGIFAEAVQDGVKALIKLADEKREPIADAAQTLWAYGYDKCWLQGASVERILECVLVVDTPAIQADALGVVLNGELFVTGSNGWTLTKKYPDREKTADAASFLWRVNNPLTDRQGSLILCAPETVRLAARYRQEEMASAVADSAWIAFDGGYKADLKCAPVKRIHELAAKAKSQEVRKELIGMLRIGGRSRKGRLVSVDLIKVFRDSGYTGGYDCKFVVGAAAEHGISLVESVSFSFGPGIYQ